MISETGAYKFSLDVFCSWFVVLMLWLPTSIGGWLVYFGFIGAGDMWLVSLIISMASALYLSCRGLKKI